MKPFNRSAKNLISQPHFNMSEVKKIPKLRFVQYSDLLINVGFTDLGKIMIGLTHTPNYIETGRPFLSSKNISQGFIDFENIKYISENEFQNLPKGSKPVKGDILFTRVGSNLGNPIVLDVSTEFGIFVSLGTFRVNDSANNYYIKYWMDTNYFWRQLEQKVAGGAKNNLNTTWLKEFRLNLPSLPEQQKIADFLTAVDKRIELLEKKKTLLETYKKGVMKKIFNQEIRFKDDNGNDFPDWEEKRLGEISKITTGRLDANAMVDGGQYRFYTCAKDYYHIDNFSFDTDALIISGNGANVGYIHHYKGKFNAYQRTYVLDGFEESILYVKFFLDRFLKSRIESEKKEGNTPYIVKSTLEDMRIQLPTLSEQIKISEFLVSIDMQIELLETQIDKSKTWKKGLLQTMFV